MKRFEAEAGVPKRGAGLIVSVALVAALGAGCEAAAETFVSPEQENMLGAQIKTELTAGTDAMPKVEFLTQPEQLASYIKNLADKVVAKGREKRPEFHWESNVIADSSQVNAFATPGGYLYVYSGLLAAADNEAELVGVMGHEVGHVLARHFARRLVKQEGLQTVIAIALGQDPNKLAAVVTEIAAQGYLLKNSRDDEREADQYGATLAHEAGYDPNGLVTFFGKLAQMEGQTPGVLQYLSTHPDPADRATEITQYIRDNKLEGGMTNAEAFQAMKKLLPPPPVVSDAGIRDGGVSDAR